MVALFLYLTSLAQPTPSPVTLNAPDTGYRGIWYMNQPSGTVRF